LLFVVILLFPLAKTGGEFEDFNKSAIFRTFYFLSTPRGASRNSSLTPTKNYIRDHDPPMNGYRPLCSLGEEAIVKNNKISHSKLLE